MEFKKIAVIGAGAWGTAIAQLLSWNGYEVILWAREEKIAGNINSNHSNEEYLPCISLSESISATNEPSDITGVDLVINAIPSQFIRPAIKEYSFPLDGKYILNLSKGIELNTLMRISEIFKELCGTDSSKFAVISGPSHAEEVVRKFPTTVVSASGNIEFAHAVQRVFSNEFFRVYTSPDVIGSELGGSLKNIIAIAAGIIDGISFGDNTKAALITRGLAEIERLGTGMGAYKETFSGLSGLGDLIVTCNSRFSRNRAVGELVGKGMKLDEILQQTNSIAEGVYTTESAYLLGKSLNIELPITEQVKNILFDNIDPRSAIVELMTRKYKAELS